MLPGPLSRGVLAWGEENVEDEELFIDPDNPIRGREDEPHVTVLYGLHTPESDEVRGMLDAVRPFQIRLGKVSRFTDCPQFDVLKVEAESEELRILHDAMKRLPNSESYPTYKPHITLAFLAKGCCRRLDNSQAFRGITFQAGEVVFSSRLGWKEVISLAC